MKTAAFEELSFSVHKLCVDGPDPFTFHDFDSMQDTVSIPTFINEDLVSLEACEKRVYEDRFIALFIEKAERYPYQPEVYVAISKQEVNKETNPRESQQLEAQDEYYVLIDTEKKRIYISSQKVRKHVEKILSKELGREVSIKALIDEGDFTKKIAQLKEISLTVEPRELRSGDSSTLASVLNSDVFGLGEEAVKAELKLSYKQKKLSDKAKSALQKFLERKGEYQKVMVTGRTDDGLESFLNMDEIGYKLTIHPGKDAITGRIFKEDAFQSLVLHIMKMEMEAEQPEI